MARPTWMASASRRDRITSGAAKMQVQLRQSVCLPAAGAARFPHTTAAMPVGWRSWSRALPATKAKRRWAGDQMGGRATGAGVAAPSRRDHRPASYEARSRSMWSTRNLASARSGTTSADSAPRAEAGPSMRLEKAAMPMSFQACAPRQSFVPAPIALWPVATSHPSRRHGALRTGRS